jgi:LacI family transcriptional regulator
MATIKDVAKRAGVSMTTVSRVLNEPNMVKERTRLRVEKAMLALAFQRNVFATSLATNRSETIGLVVPHLTDVFFAPMINEIGKAVSAHESYLIITCANYAPDEIARSVRFLQQRRCDALIVFPGAMSDEQVATMLSEIPHMVAIHRFVPQYASRCVLVDNRLGTRIATRYLIDCGHREIAVITGPSYNAESVERLATFLETMTEAGLSVDPRLIVEGDFLLESGEQAVSALLATGRRFSAVFCFSDRMAVGALSYLRSAGVSVPDDISLMGFDDVDYASLVYPRLTTVHQDIDELGRIAAEIALSLAGHEVPPPAKTILTPRLIVRESVAPRGTKALADRRGAWPAAASPAIVPAAVSPLEHPK